MRVRVELVESPRHDRYTEMQARQQGIEEPAGPGPIGRRPESIASLGKEVMRHLHPGQMSEENPMGVKGARGRSGGARGIDPHRRIVRHGIDGGEGRGGAFQRRIEIDHRVVGTVG
jgi:hypothetical protein